MTEEDGDIERLFAAAVARQPSEELRGVVLARIAVELEARHRTRGLDWQSWLLRGAAASVAFSLAAFLGVEWLEARRMARWDERAVVRSEVAQVADAVASMTDENAAKGVERYLLSRLQRDDRRNAAALDQEIEAIQHWAKGDPQTHGNQSDETTEERI